MSRLPLVAALALPLLLGAPARANHCEGSVPDTALAACTKVYGTWCVVLDRPCAPLVLP